MNAHERSALAQATLAVLFLVLMIGASMWVLRPFIGPAIWAAMVVVATWPLMRRVQRALWGRRALAAAAMTLALLLVFVVPLAVAIGTIASNADRLVDAAKAVAALPRGGPPAWVEALPLVGPSLASAWRDLAADGAGGVVERVTPYAGKAARWVVGEVGSIGFLLVQFLLTLLLAAVMYLQGEAWADTVRRVGRRLGGARGEHIVELAGLAVRGVALGVGVTAVVQSALGGLALALAGIPFAGLLTAVMLLLCLAQLGPLPVLLAAAGWLFYQGQTGWGVFMLVASAVVGTIDNVLRPVLIRMGADLPLLLILAGVVGGLFAFGLVGIFVGPVVLAVAWTLLAAWVGDVDALAVDPPADGAARAPSARAAGDAVPEQLRAGQQHAGLEQAVVEPRRDPPHDADAEPHA